MGLAILSLKFSRETEESRFVHEFPDFNNKSSLSHALPAKQNPPVDQLWPQASVLL